MKKLLIGLIILGLLAGGAVLLLKPKPKPMALLTNEALQTVLTLSDTRAKNDGGKYNAYGIVKNNDKIPHSFTLRAAFYDKERKPLGQASANINDLKPGEAREYNLLPGDAYKDFDIFAVQVVKVTR